MAVKAVVCFPPNSVDVNMDMFVFITNVVLIGSVCDYSRDKSFMDRDIGGMWRCGLMLYRVIFRESGEIFKE